MKRALVLLPLVVLIGCGQSEEVRAVTVPGGTFRVGSTDRDLDRYERAFGEGDEQVADFRAWWEREQPSHIETVEPFRLKPTEVTVGQFRRFVEATDYVTTAEQCEPCPWWYSKRRDQWVHRDDLSWRQPAPTWKAESNEPVVQVSFLDAEDYIAWRSEQDGIAYRLPTDVELEWAAWGGEERGLFPWRGRLADHANFADPSSGLPWAVGGRDGYKHAAPVASFPPNGYGLYDTLGNVWEWTSRSHWYYGTDRFAPGTREMRGGAFTARPGWTRPATRMYHPLPDSAYDIGFRLAH